MLNIALFGPPGAGKGTQSTYLIEKYNLIYISTGDLLRKEIKDGSRLGKEAKAIIEQGGLVSDEIIVQILEKTITDNPNANGFLFDGFPRTSIQSFILEGLMIQLHTKLNCLISIEVPEELSVKRLLERGQTSGRTDDNETVIRNRLSEYTLKTLPVLNFFRERGNYFPVDGTKTIDEVRTCISQIVEKELSKNLMNIVMFGYPGSGRGSQGMAIAKKYGLEYVATGKMLDEEVKNGTEVGKRIEKIYNDGELIPDDIVVPLIEKKIEHSEGVRGFIFKGFPRTLVQSYILDGILKKHDSSISKIIDIQVDTLEIIRRLDKRSKTDKGMPYDSSTERIVKRLEEHRKKTIPVIEKYKSRHDVAVIDGEADFDTVFERICNAIDTGAKNLR